jgi:hypothetical protein
MPTAESRPICLTLVPLSQHEEAEAAEAALGVEALPRRLQPKFARYYKTRHRGGSLFKHKQRIILVLEQLLLAAERR